MERKKRYRPRANRYGFTINNPFITEDTKVVDPDKMTDEQKAIFKGSVHDMSELRQPENEKYFTFAFVEYERKENFEVVERVIAERVFFKDYISAQEYFKSIDFIDYVCFQYEKGELYGNLHLQGFMHFHDTMEFNHVRALFPTMHLDKCEGKNFECREYCMKTATKVDGYDFFEHGVLIEAQQRSDIYGFKDRLKEGATNAELLDEYPHLTINSYNKLNALRNDIKREQFENITRKVHVTYIYGKADTGKTTYAQRVLKIPHKEICKIADYGSGKFDEYQTQDIILFDEFDGQILMTKMNDYLDGEPICLPARYQNKQACYTQVFIISNYPLAEQYLKERADGKEPSFKGFTRRIHEIIHIPERNVYIWERGEPSEQVVAELERQGAKITLPPQVAEQTKMGVV